MIRSMTGYGIAETLHQTKRITVEIRTLNSKQLDLALKLPNELRFAEIDFRNRIGAKLQRGKIDAVITIADTSVDSMNRIDPDVVASYLRQVREISEELGMEPSSDMAALLFRMPGIFNAPEQSYDEEFVGKINETIDKALDMVDGFRIQEGQTLKKDLLHRVELIVGLLDQVDPFEKSRHDTIKQRLLKNLSELTTEGQYDENRFEAELIYYLEKLDITEEKVRLRNHLRYFRETMDTAESDGVGKKLGFIAQEMGREINTLGSKANHSGMQIIVVKMKDLLEQIKEQVLNVL